MTNFKIKKSSLVSCITDEKDIIIPENVSIIQDKAFYDNSTIESIIIPKTVKKIESRAFCKIHNLKEIIFENGLEEIGSYAIQQCHNLKSIYIPESVNYIGDSPVFYSLGLINIEVSENNKNYTSIDGILYSKTKDSLICYPSAKGDTSFDVLNETEKIRSDCFNYSINLETINLHNNIKTISKSAFNYLDNLKAINNLNPKFIARDIIKKCPLL